jgi:hypothetical protein
VSDGPYETERDARESPAVRAVYLAYSTSPGGGTMHMLLRCLLASACTQAHVDVGAYDDAILGWLSRYEPATCQVIAGLIRRAYAAGAARGE